MLTNINIGQYYPTGSLVHKLDPRIKIILTFLFIVFLFMIRSIPGYIFALVFVLGLARLSRLKLSMLVRGLRPLRWIIVLTFIINLIFTKGQPIFSLGPVSVSQEGITTAINLSLRLVFLVVGTSILTLVTSPLSLTDGIEGVLSPLKKLGFPAHELAMMMTIALRFVPTLIGETDKIIKAQMARGADFESGNIIRRARNMVPLLVPLIINSIERADELSTAMEARCYRGSEGRTKLKPLKIQRMDILTLIACLLYFVIALYLDRLIYG